ncbi:MAG: LLM class F420-dependent oxidoreductase [Candidatus Roseilinea sp.]|nr:MAG: LLM class F420-dependent oxidoreductase [Candidatus Roseilinea sp.]
MSTPIGLNVWSRLVEDTFPYLDRVAAPFDSLWFPDHVQYGSHKVAEGWTLLAFALARYPDKLCGHEVLCNSFRNPAHLAKMAATAQAISRGRFVLGIGAGWNEEEYLAYGWPFPPAHVRIAQLAEAIQLIRALWTDAPANYTGEHYRITGAHCEPRPTPLPPIMIGGAGEKHLLRVVAQHADWWNYPYTDLATYAHKQNVLQAHCRAAGRDYDEIVQVVRVGVLVAESEAAVRHLQAQPFVRQLDGGLAGTPEQVAERLLAIIKQGADRITVHFADSPRIEGTCLFAEAVMPLLDA